MKKFKKKISAACAALLAVFLCFPHVSAEPAGLAPVPCAAYVVMDVDSGQVILEKNADTVLYPASITKIMTMALAVEKAAGDWEQTVTVSYDAVHQLEARSTHIALQEGEVVHLKDVLYATEMESANDGANVLAEFIGGDGTIAGGVEVMNQKARELGLDNTHYVNPHGLYEEGHYTTARDMARITRWALSIPGFEELFTRTENWEMAPTNKQEQARVFHNIDWMRIGGDYYRDYAKGSKAGFHNQALHTFVTYAVQGDLRLISVELGCPQKNDKFKAAGALLDYAFEHFQRVSIPTPRKSFPVELVGGGGPLGSVQVKAGESSFLLHDSLRPEDVTVSYDIPEQYVLGQPFFAQAEYALPDGSVQSQTLGSREMTVEGLPEVLQANTYIPQSSLPADPDPVAIVLGAAAAAVALLLIWRLLYRGKEEGLPFAGAHGRGAYSLTRAPRDRGSAYFGRQMGRIGRKRSSRRGRRNRWRR